MDIPTTLIVSYSVFSFFLFYQQIHLKNFQGDDEIFEFSLAIYAFGGMLFGFCFLIYWGYMFSWLQAVSLFGIAFAIKLVWFPIEAKLGLTNLYWFFSGTGFIAIPVSGYYMWSNLP